MRRFRAEALSVACVLLLGGLLAIILTLILKGLVLIWQL